MQASKCGKVLKAENLAHWYLRLNGFMVQDNFVLHPEHKPYQTRTDADIFGVRFPLRKELSFEDDERFRSDDRPRFIIAEITQGQCKLNGPWTEPGRKNMNYVLDAIGAFPPGEIDAIAASLYAKYCFEDAKYRFSLLAFGKAIDSKYAGKGKGLIQIEFREVVRFIFDRFTKFRNEKKDHQHWDPAGHLLWKLSGDHRSSIEAFSANVLREFGINEAP